MVWFLVLLIVFIGVFTTILIAGFYLRLRDSILVSVPFVSTQKRAIPAIIKALGLSSGSVLFDLGCGNSEVIKAAIANTSGAKGVGVERGYIPFLLARFNTRGLPIAVCFQDIFSADLSGATHVYCYLSSKMMEELLPKFQRECKKGTRIVSCDFQIPKIIPVQTILLDAGIRKLSRTLYVYEIGDCLTSDVQQ